MSSWEVTKVTQVTENGGLYENGSGVGKQHLSCAYILKVESTGFVH